MRFRRRKEEPTPPRGVTLNRIDGSKIPLEVVYVGKDHGYYVWRTVLEARAENGDYVSIDELPGMTRVELGFWVQS